jgi:hypothetical protein
MTHNTITSNIFFYNFFKKKQEEIMHKLVVVILMLCSLQIAQASGENLESYNCIDQDEKKSVILITSVNQVLSFQYTAGKTTTIYVDTSAYTSVEFESSEDRLSYFSSSDKIVRHPWFGNTYRRIQRTEFNLDKITLQGSYYRYLKNGWAVEFDEDNHFKCKIQDRES